MEIVKENIYLRVIQSIPWGGKNKLLSNSPEAQYYIIFFFLTKTNIDI